jgi:hypothetical protein
VAPHRFESLNIGRQEPTAAKFSGRGQVLEGALAVEAARAAVLGDRCEYRPR